MPGAHGNGAPPRGPADALAGVAALPDDEIAPVSFDSSTPA